MTISNRTINRYFNFTKYLYENFEYWDNTDMGDVYKKLSGEKVYTKREIFEEWKKDTEG